MSEALKSLTAALFGTGGLIRVRAALALVLVGTACYLWIDGKDVPVELLTFSGMVVGTYFGARIANNNT